MPRPYTDIAKIHSSEEINNGAAIIGGTFTGQYGQLNTYTKHTPDISTIQSKYGNRFYNGIFVNIISGDLNAGQA